MEIIKVAKAIEAKIKLLEKGRAELHSRAERKAETIAEYEKVLAIKIIQLKNGVEFQCEGQVVKDPPNTIVERIARGLCWKEKLEMEKAEAFYKNAVIGLQAIESELNGFQSINRYLEERSQR